MKTNIVHTSFVTTLVFALFVSLSFLVFPSMSQAQMGLFGGQSEEAEFCSCSLCFKVDVGDPKSGDDLMWCPFTGTDAYAYYNVMPSAWQLGTKGMYRICWQISYPRCTRDGGGPLMELSGTSMY